ncbi:MAG: anti-sigma factor antagonist [Verrucomicrobia bacterium]|nr:anti-sigma factor antagonist [Verrucomicrobiota bacterium]
MLTVKESQIGAAIILECSGRLDVVTGPTLDAKIPDGGVVVLDMAELNYVSSAGLRSILQALKKLQPKGGSLRLSSLQPDVQRLLELSGEGLVVRLNCSGWSPRARAVGFTGRGCESGRNRRREGPDRSWYGANRGAS